MTKTEILEFLNANPPCYLATSGHNKPHVRAMRMHRADEKGIIFQTVDGKDLPKQLTENPHVEVCFYNMKTHNWGLPLTFDKFTIPSVLTPADG